MNTAVEVNKLTKKYNDLTAVDEIDFSIEKGEIFGLLGPNGAGKTTTVEMIEGLRKPDGGSITVCGIDAQKDRERIKEIIGVQLQSTTIYDKIRVGEVIDLFGGYYKKALTTRELLDMVSLYEKKDEYVSTLSGGQKQRVALALALVNDPEVVFLDEPTTGLDPQARRNVWDIVEQLGSKGKTVILTTHYMEEAERLCTRLGIIDHGKIIALETPRNLIARQNLESAIEFTSSNGTTSDDFEKIPGVNKVSRDGWDFIIQTSEASRVLGELTRLAEENTIHIDNISVRKATLEDVFLALTGRKLRG